mgnify:CR=1 FL=1
MSRIITSIILLMTMGFCGCGLSRRNTDDIDGGVKTYNSGEDSPKVIESTEIISFEFEVSLYNIVLEEESTHGSGRNENDQWCHYPDKRNAGCFHCS